MPRRQAKATRLYPEGVPAAAGPRCPPNGSSIARCLYERAEAERVMATLTKSEVEIVVCLAWGLGAGEVAAHKRISKRTVERHMENIAHKAGCCTRARDLMMLGWCAGVMHPEFPHA